MGKKKKALQQSTNTHHVRKHSIHTWLLCGRQRAAAASCDAKNHRRGAAISLQREDDVCRAYYISKPTEMSPRLTWPPPQGAVRASERFFVPPIVACSLMEEARLSAASGGSTCSSVEDSTAVVAYSKEPYHDFLRSMAAMVEAHHVEREEGLDWEFMEELLFCYLELNERSVHEDIFRAFTDLTENLN
ncbi:hypothetical protein Cni_G16891 [Canna indica]|uniref:Transcription repressor n=1 Tax=Canna indica TaxID=4628 RepID=A0AAQ3KFZ4_9LILI|nr:hypothetical protein Cni_G16891 [Canna indica]